MSSNVESLIAGIVSSDDTASLKTPRKNCFGCSDERTIWTRIWQGVAGASLIVNIVAMAIEASIAAIIAGIVACIIAPVVIYLQQKMQNTETLRTVQNQLRQEVARLHTENNKLSSEVTQLETQVGRLQGEEKKLATITAKQGKDVDQFIGLVKENRETVDQLKAAVKADLMQTLITACIDSDFDQSGKFSDQEVKILEVRMKSLPGVLVNHELLAQTVNGSDRQLETILALTSHLDRTDMPDNERIFRFDESRLQPPKSAKK